MSEQKQMNHPKESLRPSQRKEAVQRLIAWTCCTSALRSTEPLFCNWEKIPRELREDLKQLQSDDLKDIRVDRITLQASAARNYTKLHETTRNYTM